MENSPESKSNTNKLRSFITSVSSQAIAHLLRCATVCQSAVNHVPGLICKGSTRSIPPSPFTLHPSPFTLHPSPLSLPPSPFTLHPSPFTLHPSPFIRHPSSLILAFP